MEFVLKLATVIAAFPWLMMIFLPKWGPTRWFATSSTWATVLCGLYTLLVLPLLPALFPLFVNSTTNDLASTLGQKPVATMMWIHLQAFSLLVGFQIYRRSLTRGLSIYVTAPVLLLTMTAGPVGFFVFRLIDRFSSGGSPDLEEHAEV